MTTANQIDDFYAIIPAGGIGSRLWPLSRADAPKFLHDLTGSGQSLLADTWDRLTPLAAPANIVVVTGDAHVKAVRRELPALADDNVFREPSPKDSTAAICLAAAVLIRRNPDAVIGSFAADHVIADERRFRAAVREAVAVAREGFIVTIGILPTSPATAFGYIEMGDHMTVAKAPRAHVVKRFVEKPDLAIATEYFEDDIHLWNAGMFISRADVLLDELRANRPDVADALAEIAEAWDTDARASVLRRVWPTLNKVAIDYSVAEPAAEHGRLAVVQGDFRWDDVGDFASLARLHNGGRPNVLATLGEHTRVLNQGASGVVVSQSSRLITVIGVKDIVIVDTPDALLVTTAAHAQRVKGIVETIRQTGDDDVL
ncbi:mannose-1-phosphate guanylyltransferase [Microbacteriaceae bacterium MWH-Ta3]|nr:mannose-1-phosphate guanylyltransferase [Microbacteriaceae bacterium MWH-Ta3]